MYASTHRDMSVCLPVDLAVRVVYFAAIYPLVLVVEGIKKWKDPGYRVLTRVYLAAESSNIMFSRVLFHKRQEKHSVCFEYLSLSNTDTQMNVDRGLKIIAMHIILSASLMLIHSSISLSLCSNTQHEALNEYWEGKWVLRPSGGKSGTKNK